MSKYPHQRQGIQTTLVIMAHVIVTTTAGIFGALAHYSHGMYCIYS